MGGIHIHLIEMTRFLKKSMNVILLFIYFVGCFLVIQGPTAIYMDMSLSLLFSFYSQSISFLKYTICDKC